MYLISAAWTAPGAPPAMALVRRDRKYLEKIYRLLDIRRFDAKATPAEIMDAVMTWYEDDRFLIRKPRFNQIGRPRRIVDARPFILMTRMGSGQEIIDDMRGRRLAVESFDMTASGEWEACLHAPGRGYDFRVGRRELLSTMDCILNENRFAIELSANTEPVDWPGKEFTDFQNALGRAMEGTGASLRDEVFAAVSLPIWYYENLLKIRPKTP